MSSVIDRIGRLRDLLSLDDDSTVLVTDLTDIRYLTGFSGSNGWLVVGTDSRRLVTDGRYSEQAREQTDCDVLEARSVDEMFAHLDAIASRSLLFESAKVSFDFHARLSAVRPDLVAIGDRLSSLRRPKDHLEIETIERAVSIADRALAEVCPRIDVGWSERDVRDELDHLMRRHGADGPSYDTIVASGPVNSARPHHRPTDRLLEEGDWLVIDVGALLDGYHSDMTRTFVIGEHTPILRERYELVRESQRRGIDRVRPGVRCQDVDRTCRQVFEQAGLDDEFVHGTGHGVGLLIHEEPFISRGSAATLRPGDVVTVEPGLYRVGLGGIRIEDLLVVDDGGSRVLSTFPKELICLPSRPTI